jgi:hypothetical protein
MINISDSNKPRETLAILAIFRNEADIMEEWMEHHINEGVDHFYLINNQSTDNYSEILARYKDKITLYQHDRVYNVDTIEKTFGGQIESYEMVLPDIKEDWLYVVDLDEFAYVRKPYTSIKDLLLKEGHRFDQIIIKLKQFTSAGLIKQPDNVVDNFTVRWDHNVYRYLLGKAIVRTNKIDRVDINNCFLKKDCITVDGNLENPTDFFIWENKNDRNTVHEYLNATEQSILDDVILSNHYSVQSRDWFWNVKTKRGVVAWIPDKDMTINQWWERYWNWVHKPITMDDFELRDIKRKNINK